jgi:hypothetical protein
MIERVAPRNPWVASYGSDTDYNFANPGSSFQNAPGSSSYGPGSTFQNAPGAFGPSFGSTFQSNMPGPPGAYDWSLHAAPPSGSTPAAPTQDYLQDKANYGMWQGLMAGNAQFGVQRAQNQAAMQSAGIGVLGALADQQQGTNTLNQNYGTDVAHLQNQMAGNQVDIGANARQPGFLTALHNIAGQQFDLTRQGEQTNADVSRRGLESQLTGRGAFTSIGGQQGRFDIANQLLQQTQGTNLQQQGETTRFNESMAQTQDQKQKLDLQAKDYGITGQELSNHLQQGLDRLNLSTSTSVADLMNKMNSGTVQEAAIAQQIISNAMQNSDYYSRLYPGQQAAAGAYNPIQGAGPTEKTYPGGGGNLQR